MAVSALSNSANLKTAARNAAASIGVDPANLTYDERTAFNKALAAEILKYPRSFSDATLETARRIDAKAYQPLDDEGFDLSDFANLTVDNAGKIVDAAGSQLRTLSIVAVLAVAAFYILPGALARANAKPAK